MATFAPSVSQKDFDNLIQSYRDEGQDFNEAVTEACETLKDGGVSLDSLWIPQSPDDNTLKIQTEERITTLEKTAHSGLPEDYVNATFAMGSLKSSMTKGEGGIYLYRLMETRGVLRTTIGMLKCSVETEEMAERAMHINPEEESDEEDEDEERALRVVKICDFFLYHYSEIKLDRYRDPLIALKLTKDDNDNIEIYEMIATILDQYADDAQVMHPFLDVMRVLCQVESNCEHFKEISSIQENIDLTSKMNKKNIGIVTKSGELMAMLQKE